MKNTEDQTNREAWKALASVIRKTKQAKPTGGVPVKTFNSMKTKTVRSDFSIRQTGHGTWKVTYTSPVTGNCWTGVTHDAELIDAFQAPGREHWLNEEPTPRKTLEALKRIAKAGGMDLSEKDRAFLAMLKRRRKKEAKK
jgi:hypothetical protein